MKINTLILTYVVLLCFLAMTFGLLLLTDNMYDQSIESKVIAMQISETRYNTTLPQNELVENIKSFFKEVE